MYAETIFEVNGFEYRVYEDHEDDNIKFFHECWKDGKELTMPYEFYNHSPYSYMSKEEFSNFLLEAFVQSK